MSFVVKYVPQISALGPLALANELYTMYRVIINDYSRSRPRPCYEIFAAFM
jgi:hypothetical protein